MSATRMSVQDRIEELITRVERKYKNDCADNACRAKYQQTNVGEWLAGVSYDEWFALVETLRGAEEGNAE